MGSISLGREVALDHYARRRPGINTVMAILCRAEQARKAEEARAQKAAAVGVSASSVFLLTD